MKRKDFIKWLSIIFGGILSAFAYFRFHGQKKGKLENQSANASNSLLPFEGQLSSKQIAFLLGRTTFGVSSEDVQKYLQLGLDKTIDKLFTYEEMPEPPINFEFEKDIYTPIGSSWVESPYMAREVFLEQYRKKSLQAWIMGVIYNEGVSIREQLVLFWHNHYGVSDIVEHKFEYIHNVLLRKYAWGNFKELTKAITIDPAMLHFLSGFENTKESPNENYARELLELFTIGKGDLVSPGDYTTYTEMDVRNISKILTGWTYVGWYSNFEHEPIKAIFHPDKHENEKIKLSKALNKTIIPPLLEERYKYLIDEIFKIKEVALNICRKLYRWFVHYDITDVIENEIIDKLAVQLIKEQFEIQPILQTLLKSNHFFERMIEMPKIKNPIEYAFNTLKKIPNSIPSDPLERYKLWHNLFDSVTSMGLEYFKPPSVAGWKSYYQEPLYYKLWINAATLKNRINFNEQIISTGFENVAFNLDFQELIVRFHKLGNFEDTLEYFNKSFVSFDLSEKHLQKIKSILLENIDEKNWIDILKNASLNKSKQEYKTMVENIKKTLNFILNLPEYNIL